MNHADVKVTGATMLGWVTNLSNFNEILTAILTTLSIGYVAVRLVKEFKKKNGKETDETGV
tara:strand:- start:145 stop:327 length:183 start_codon:yes stop_codon:yes gene_type:complete